METNVALVSQKTVLTSTTLPNPQSFSLSTKHCLSLPPKPTGWVQFSRPRSRTFVVFALSNPNSRTKHGNGEKINGVEKFASTSRAVNSRTSTAQETTSVGVVPQPYAYPNSQFGSPLFWIGVGVGFSALFSFAAARIKKYAMQQAFKTMMGQMGSQNNQFSNAAFSPGSPFGFPPPSTTGPSTSSGFPYQLPSTPGPSTSTGSSYSPPSTAGTNTSTGSTSPVSHQATSPPSAVSEASVAVDVSATKVQAPEPTAVKDETEIKTEAKQSAFVDVSPEEASQKSPFEDFHGSSSQTSTAEAKLAEVVENGAASQEASTANEGSAWSQSTRKTGSVLSVEALEKLMEDPNVQKLIYPQLPEEMRNPATFKWMLQNPVYRQQLQEMLDNMGGGGPWDQGILENLKNFDINSPGVKQQFDQLGLTPEEVISKIMANPDVAMAFQNPKVQQAIMDCSQNPWNIAKYQDDAEIMSVFNKIQQLFPGATGPGFGGPM